MDTSIYEYRNGSLWWSRETNSTILNATAGLSVIARGSAVQKHAVSLFFLSCLRGRCSLAHVSSSLSRSLSQIHIHIHIHKVCVCVCVCVFIPTPILSCLHWRMSSPLLNKRWQTCDTTCCCLLWCEIHEMQRFRFISRPDSVVMNSQRTTKAAVNHGGTGGSSAAAWHTNARASSADASVASTQDRAEMNAHGTASNASGGHSGGAVSTRAGGVAQGGASEQLGDTPEKDVTLPGRGKQGGVGAHLSTGLRGASLKGRQLAATHGGFAVGPETESSPSSLDIVSSIVAVSLLVVGAVYVKRLFSSRKSPEDLPRYSRLDES